MDSSSFLIKEYEALQNDSKRKFPSVAKICKSTINTLKKSNKDIEVLCKSLLAPIEEVFEIKAQKVYSNALFTLGKL